MNEWYETLMSDFLMSEFLMSEFEFYIILAHARLFKQAGQLEIGFFYFI